MQYRRISADCHLDMIWLPPDLFTSEAPRALKEKMPYVKEMPDGTKRWVDNNGADYGMAGGVGASGTPYMPGKQLRVDKMHAAGLYTDYQQKGLRRPGDPHLRVKELDRDGVDAEVIYGILAAALIWLRHIDNIQRLLAGTERKIGQKAQPIGESSQ